MWIVFFCNIAAGISVISFQSSLLEDVWGLADPSGYIQPGDQGSGNEGADEEVAPDTYAADDMIIFLGYGGQKVWVSPSNNLVIVRATVKWADSWVETKIPNAVLNALERQTDVSSAN